MVGHGEAKSGVVCWQRVYLQLSAVKALGERALARRCPDARAAAQRQRGIHRQRQPLLHKP